MRHDYGAERKVFAGWKALINELLEYEALFLKMQDGQWFHYSHKSDLKGLMWSQVQSFKVEKMNRDNGWINDYKYGVEYPTNGKKPDLISDVVISWRNKIGESGTCMAGELEWKIGDNINEVVKFRILDERYKPKAEQLDNSWHERGELPPVGTVCEILQPDLNNDLAWRKVKIIAYTEKSVVIELNDQEFLRSKDNEFRPLKTEREKFIEAALKKFDDVSDYFPPIGNSPLLKLFGNMFDAGFRAPEAKQ